VEPPDGPKLKGSSSFEAEKPAKVVTSPSVTAAAKRGWKDKEQRARERAKGPEEDATSITAMQTGPHRKAKAESLRDKN
jgi:hypothetical protein